MRAIGSYPFYLIKRILSISNEMLGFKVNVFNGVYEVNIDTTFKKFK